MQAALPGHHSSCQSHKSQCPLPMCAHLQHRICWPRSAQRRCRLRLAATAAAASTGCFAVFPGRARQGAARADDVSIHRARATCIICCAQHRASRQAAHSLRAAGWMAATAAAVVAAQQREAVAPVALAALANAAVSELAVAQAAVVAPAIAQAPLCLPGGRHRCWLGHAVAAECHLPAF
jgi:hypothetical protein